MLMSESGGAYSWDMASDELKKLLFGLMVVNNLAESAFEGLTAQLEVFGRIDLTNAAAVSDMQRNGELKRPNLENNEVRMYFGLPEELQITATMTAVKLAPAIRNSNNNKQTRFEENKREREKLVMQEGNDKMTDLMIDRMIYRWMYESDGAWKTVAAVRKGVEDLKYNKYKMAGLRDNIQMDYLGMGRADAQTNWSENCKQKTIPQLTDRLIEIIKMFKECSSPRCPKHGKSTKKEAAGGGYVDPQGETVESEREGKLEEFNMRFRK